MKERFQVSAGMVRQETRHFDAEEGFTYSHNETRHYNTLFLMIGARQPEYRGNGVYGIGNVIITNNRELADSLNSGMVGGEDY